MGTSVTSIEESSQENNSFVKNILRLMTGSTIAQAIPIAISPILTRLYTPRDFGVYGIFFVVVSIFGSVANGRYELAIMLPDKDEDAINVAALGFCISLIISLTWLLVVIIFDRDIAHLLGNDGLCISLYLSPIAIFLMGFFNVLNYLNTRMKLYTDIAKASIYKSLAMSVVQISFGCFKQGVIGLVLGDVISRGCANFKLFKNISAKKMFYYISFENMKRLGKRYINFPKYASWSMLLNTASVQLPMIFFARFFDLTVAGYFSFVSRLLAIPSGLLGASVGQVFYQEASLLKNDKKALGVLTEKTYKRLLLLGIFPFSLLTVFGDHIFDFVFGASWIIAGQYAQMLSIWILFVFISSPLSGVLLILEKQCLNLMYNIFLFSSRIVIIILGGFFIKNSHATILIYGIVGAIFWIFWSVYILYLAGSNIRNVLRYTVLLSIIFFPPLISIRFF